MSRWDFALAVFVAGAWVWLLVLSYLIDRLERKTGLKS